MAMHKHRVLASLRLVEMSPYAFGQLDQMKVELDAAGKEVIDLSLGSPDRPTDSSVLKALTDSMTKLRNQQYPIFSGQPKFKQDISEYFARRFGVELDPNEEILPLLGSKEGIGHLAFAYIQEGDMTIIPSPYYPVHMRGTVLSGGHVYELELKPENNFVGDLDAIPEEILIRSKMLILSYPHNPTGAVVDADYLKKAVDLCKEYGIILVNDFAYADIWFDDNRAPSILAIPGGKDVAIEFHTFSKLYNMAGMRLGYAVGNPEIVHTLFKLKTNLDYGVCMGIQEAGSAALRLDDDYREEIRLEYERRRDAALPLLEKMGLEFTKPGGAMYIWVKIPDSFKDSFEFSSKLLEKTGVALVPGLTFGKFGERYVRIALVQSVEKIELALNKMAEFLKTV